MKYSTDYIRRLGKRVTRSKRGSTLVELIATLAILSIVATFSLQAIMIAHEESIRVNNVSVSQRSISLMQENLNKYVKNTVEIDLVNVAENIDTTGTFQKALNDYILTRNTATPPRPFMDHDTSPDTDNYDDYVLYRSGTFSYTLAKYSKVAMKFQPVFTVDDIKEINFTFKLLTGTQGAGKGDYEVDYVISSPTGKESVFVKGGGSSELRAKANAPWTYGDDFKQTVKDNLTKGDYSIITGTVLNNMYGDTSTASSVRISEGFTTNTSASNYDASKDNDGSYRNFIVMRILPKTAV